MTFSNILSARESNSLWTLNKQRASPFFKSLSRNSKDWAFSLSSFEINFSFFLSFFYFLSFYYFISF